MERDDLIHKYHQEITDILEQYQLQMGHHLLEQADFLEKQVGMVMKVLGEKMKQQQKEYVSFLYISIPKVDLIHRKYQFLLHAMNHLWYLDEESIEVYFEAGDLFHPFDEVWDRLNEISREYFGYVNCYDIQNIMFQELKFIDHTISHILRYRLRDWEKKGFFTDVTLAPYWLLKWGDDRGESEFILQTDRTVKEKATWKKDVKKARYKPETLVFSYWYQEEHKGSRLKDINMKFIVFEETKLSDMVFYQCDMEGSRFNRTHLQNCSFENCNLWGADFTGATFEQVSFTGAELTGAVFPAESIPFLNLEPGQLQAIFLQRED